MNRGFFTFSTKPSLIPVATGGTISYSGAYKYHRFTSSSSFIVKEKGYVDVLVVGGGGAGGSTAAGGGGGGGVVLRLNYYVDIGTIPVRVGAGGLIGNSRGNGNNGDFSAFGIIIAEGGGGGCGYDASPESINKARNGGCGGGDAWYNHGAGTGYNFLTDPSGELFVYGNNGGDQGNGAPAGGGGAGIGQVPTTQHGGDGILIWGEYWAGGGGGGTDTAPGGSGGLGGGGDGGPPYGPGTAGDANTGGGGGGGGGMTQNLGASGGSGIVIVRYFIS